MLHPPVGEEERINQAKRIREFPPNSWNYSPGLLTLGLQPQAWVPYARKRFSERERERNGEKELCKCQASHMEAGPGTREQEEIMLKIIPRSGENVGKGREGAPVPSTM